MDKVLEQLKTGVRRFQAEVYPLRAEIFAQAAREPQRPHTLFVTCADSRIDPVEITDSGTGEVFVTRNIGNMVPTYGEMLGGVSAVIEFAVSSLGVRHIVVCGHSDCGAMKALQHPGKLDGMSSVQSWLKHADVAQHVTAEKCAHLHGEDYLRCLTEENVVAQLEHLRTLPAVAVGMARGNLNIHGWIFDIPDAELRAFDGAEGRFVDVPVSGRPVPKASPMARFTSLAATAA